MNEGYPDLIQKLNLIIDEIAPVKEMCIKNNTEEWVDEETFEAIMVRDKNYKRFKRTRLHIDHVNYRKSRNKVNKFIKRKKGITLKMLGLPSKKEGQAKICLGKEGNISFDAKSNAEILKNVFAEFAMNLVRQQTCLEQIV